MQRLRKPKILTRKTRPRPADHDHDHHDHTLEDLADELGLFVAVIGATVAEETGLKLGSSFVPAHDVMTGGGAHEDAPTRVVGVLAPTGTPIDRAIYIPAGAFYAIAGHQATEGSAFGGTRDPHGVSAVLAYVTPSGGYHLRTRYAWNDRLDVQAAWPVMEVRKLFAVVGNIDSALRIIAALVVVVALVGVLVALSNTMAARQREFAVLRALGARRRTILALVVGESAAISILGGILGLGLAGIGAWVAASRVRAETGVSLSPMPGLDDLWFLLAVTAVGALSPAWFLLGALTAPKRHAHFRPRSNARHSQDASPQHDSVPASARSRSRVARTNQSRAAAAVRVWKAAQAPSEGSGLEDVRRAQASRVLAQRAERPRRRKP